MHAATGTFRLNAAASKYLEASLLHLIERESDVIGRYGHHGFVTGVMHGNVLNATLRDIARHGVLIISFNDHYHSFAGVCRFCDDDMDHEISGTRVARHGKRK